MDQWLVILLRSIGLFFLTLGLVRIIGKRHPAKMTPFSFIVYSVIAVLVALISTNIIRNFAFGIIALLVWALIPILLDYITLKSKVLHDFIIGKETILVKDGKVMEENLSQLRLTGEDFLSGLRTKNIFNLADVEFAIMEPTGDINVMLKSEKSPVTPYHLGQKVAPQDEPQTVILDGNILNESLSNLGLNHQWINTQLEAMGLSLDNVFIGQVNTSGDLYVDLFDDSIQTPQPKVKEKLYASLEAVQADLMSYSLETDNKEAKEMYSKDADEMKKLIEKLEPYLLR